MILKNDVLREQDLLELLVRVEIGNVLQKSRNHLVKRASVCVCGGGGIKWDKGEQVIKRHRLALSKESYFSILIFFFFVFNSMM